MGAAGFVNACWPLAYFFEKLYGMEADPPLVSRSAEIFGGAHGVTRSNEPWDKQFSIRLSTWDGKSTQTWEIRVKMGWAGTNPTPKNAMGNTLGGLKYISHDPIAADFSWSALGAQFSIAVPFSRS